MDFFNCHSLGVDHAGNHFRLACSDAKHLPKSKKVQERLLKIDGSQSKIIFVAESFNSYQKDSVNFDNLPFELWEIKRFSNKTIVLNKHKSNSKESIGSFTDGKKNTVLENISKEVKVYTEKDHTSKTSLKMNEKWLELKDSMIELTGTELIPKKDYISLCSEDSSHKTIAYFNFQKNAIRMDFNVGNIYTDGSKSKGFFILDDPKKVSSLRTWEWKNGVIGNVYKVPISNETDIDYVMFLLKQKYKNLRNSTN